MTELLSAISQPPARLTATSLSLGYGDRLVAAGVDLAVPDGRVTAIVGPNACGKSTLLRGLARLLRPLAGTVRLDGGAIHTRRTKDLARELGMLPQAPTAPDGISVFDLVSRGRTPYQHWLRQWDPTDEAAVAAALAATRMTEHAKTPVDELSGGQRQRAWLAMALAQETPILLLDEPTTYLDLAHQIEVLDLVLDLNRTAGRTVVMVLHDLNHACRYADWMVAMKDGVVVAEGIPGELVTTELIERVFGLSCRIIPDPVTGTPLIVPLGRHHGEPAPGPDH